MVKLRQTSILAFRVLFVFFFVRVLAGTAFAQGGPPLLTDDPGTPGNKHWEINIAFTESKFDFGTAYELPHLDLNYGYGNNLQLKLEGPFTIFNGPGENFAAFGYSNWGVKWRFQEEGKYRPALSTYPQILFVGNSELAKLGVLDPGTDIFLPMEILKSFGAFQLDGEIGPLFRQFAPTQFATGICAEYDLTKRFALLGEVHDFAATDYSSHEPIWNLGFKADLSEHESILFSAGRGFGTSSDDNPGFLMYAGIQLRL
jgi:hypothetical protein